MKASEFYTLAYNEAGKTNATGRAVIMRGASALIDASHAYESGKITKRKFENLDGRCGQEAWMQYKNKTRHNLKYGQLSGGMRAQSLTVLLRQTKTTMHNRLVGQSHLMFLADKIGLVALVKWSLAVLMYSADRIAANHQCHGWRNYR